MNHSLREAVLRDCMKEAKRRYPLTVEWMKQEFKRRGELHYIDIVSSIPKNDDPLFRKALHAIQAGIE